MKQIGLVSAKRTVWIARADRKAGRDVQPDEPTHRHSEPWINPKSPDTRDRMGVIDEEHEDAPEIATVKLTVTVDLKHIVGAIRERSLIRQHYAWSVAAIRCVPHNFEPSLKLPNDRRERQIRTVRGGIVNNNDRQLGDVRGEGAVNLNHKFSDFVALVVGRNRNGH